MQMLLGVFSAKGVLPLEFKPAHSVGDLVVQHLDELEGEAQKKGGVEAVLAEHFAQVYKVRLPRLPHMQVIDKAAQAISGSAKQPRDRRSSPSRLPCNGARPSAINEVSEV